MKRSPPRKGRSYAILAALAAAMAFTVLVAPGCGLQGEGQRCNRNVSATPNDLTTGNDDCDTSPGVDLVCVSKDILGGSSDICCPKNKASTNPNCLIGGTGEGGSAGATTAAVTSGGATTSSVTSTSAATTTSTGTTTTSSSTSTSTSSGTTSSTGSGTGGAGGGP